MKSTASHPENDDDLLQLYPVGEEFRQSRGGIQLDGGPLPHPGTASQIKSLTSRRALTSPLFRGEIEHAADRLRGAG